MSVADPRAAARNALTTWLGSQLSGVTVSETWPTPGKRIQVPAVTVIAGNTIKTQYHRPRLWKTTTVSGASGTTLYSYGRAEINLQLDCWEAFPASRDVLAQRLEAAVNVPPQTSLGLGGLADYAAAGGLVLAMPNYYGVYCEFVTEPIAGTLPETSNAAQTGEWRQTFAVTAYLHIVNQDTVPLLQTAIVELALNGESPESITVAP
jgi:hypothetical protein